MSEPIDDITEAIDTALHQSDAVALRTVAQVLKENGEDEEAETLLDTAKKLEHDEWSFDEARDNGI